MADYSQTHAVPSEGLPAWAGPDGSGLPVATLDPGLDVMVLESRGQRAHIRCSNGWEAWVDGRRLIVSQPSPAAAPAPAPPPPTQQAPSTPPPPTQQAPSPPPQPGAPSAPWATPAAAAGAPRAAGGLRIGPGQILALVGGLLFFVSAWFTWIRYEFVTGGGASLSESFSAYRIPAHILLDSQSELGGLSLGIVIAFFGVACTAAAVISGMSSSLRFVSLVAGTVAFLVVVLFLVQTKYLSDQLPSLVESGYFSLLRFGAYIALVGAILSLIGGVLTLAQKRS